MELGIPLSRFILANMSWGQPRVASFRKTIPIEYNENGVHFSGLVLVLQPLRVVSYDEEKSQLILEDHKKSQCFSKLEALQTWAMNSLDENQSGWLSGITVPRDHSMQPWIRQKRLSLHLSSQKDKTPFFTSPGLIQININTIKPGDILRAVVKIKGLSLQMENDSVWTGKSRIQHHVLQLYKVDPTSD